MGSGDDERIDLQSAADELEVHYQTAYRWVRSGRLRAEMVDGRYLVLRADMDKLETSRRAPKSPPPPSSGRLDHAGERMLEALITGDEPAATKLFGRLVDEGASIVALIQEVLVPPLRSIGKQWSDGDVTISTEHRASAIVERILGEFAPNPRGRRRGTAVVVALSGDRHSLPTTMAAVALRSDNWHVHHLGADLPPEELVGFCNEHDVSLVVISATEPGAQELAESTATDLRAAGISTLVGGAGRTLDELIEDARNSRHS